MNARLRVLGTLMAVSAILLAACSSAATATLVSDQDLDLAPELAVGILKLEDTDQAVTSAQAAELLTFWQAYRVLSGAETTAQAELDALVQQIQGALSDEQWQSIQAMQLTSQSVDEMSQSLAAEVEIDSASGTGEDSASGQSFLAGPGEMGGGPGGMPSDDMGVIMGGAGMDLSAQSTPDAAAQALSNTQNAQITPVLLTALIALLQSRI